MPSKIKRKKSKGKLLEPWFRASRNAWFICLNGKQINLGSDKEAAQEEFHRLLSSKAPLANSPQDTPVKILLDMFLEWVKNNRSPETYISYRFRLLSFTSYLKSVGLDALTVKQLKRHHVHEWVDSHTTWNPGMRRGRMGAVQRALNWAVNHELIEKSPIAYLEKPSQGKREVVITREEYQEILKHSGSQELADLITVAWETGCRPQEITRVEASNFDPKGKRWLFQLSKSKGKKKVRVVNLTERAYEITKRLAASYPTEGKLFRNSEGAPWNAWALNCAFRRIRVRMGKARLKAQGVNKPTIEAAKEAAKKFTLYDFRHTFVTRALINGVDPITVANLVGHANLNMIASVYSHLGLDHGHLKRSLEKVNSEIS